MNQTAKKLREAADYMKGEGVTSLGAIIRLHEMFDVADPGTAPANLGAILDAIADELDELDDKATRRRSHIVQLESTIIERNREMLKLRGQIPSERERQILDMWPRFEDGAYVWLGDRFGDNKGEPRKIEGITLYSHGIDLYDDEGFHKPLDHGERLKLPVQSVLGADGVEIKVGDTVWTLDGLEGVVTKVEDGAAYIAYESDYAQCEEAANLTHTPPDSWERLEEDVNAIVTGDGLYHRLNNYCSARDLGGDDVMRLTIGDIVRRAKALAGVEAE